MKILKFQSMKKYLFKIQGAYVPGGVDIDFILVRAVDLSTAKATMKSILRHKKKLATTKDGYTIMSITCLDDVKDNVALIDGVYYQY